MVEFSFEQLDKIMQNMGQGQFSYDVLKAAYDSDPRVAEIVSDFNKEMISLKDSEMDDLKKSRKQGKDDVSTMAKRATKVGSKL
tara:strand:+ start:130 stop:381 length:252 start_codon:yes stop_codon:yes gene_type:complete